MVPQLQRNVGMQPPGGQTQEFANALEVFCRQVVNAKLLLKQLSEAQQVFGAGEQTVIVQDVVLKFLELSGLICKSTVPRDKLLGPLLYNLLEKHSQLLLPLHPPRDCLLPEILRKKGGREHVGEKPEGEGKREFCEGDDDEKGERDQLHAIRCGAHQQLMLPEGQLLSRENLSNQPLGDRQISSHQSKTGDDPLAKMDQ
mmetsp:Transcript_5870/g.12785  ORF Transcript_5870/g.12785 Transcript_5870/m.12785 type:complete len:200 (-) Transcript_5870:425-1024(-)|eukprot:CAMPEP_0204302036 /NCGR_PEP_ID=MMETSP0468-20130131/81443_1 /ASSEMBLY_ACC=CAM_ASM_000383 /TAXON_ID=2969 /ORGANISM="Oxyrrhis marina" /LENGTH=199 /DNA_ID=CAMNT_0051281223 /DNA_START=90 /DNA_END=689 /DNA_ORIENTATION=-